MVPTKERNASSIFFKLDSEGLLFDCGEGTQRQMNIAGINRNSISKIFISHWHGDHVAGLVGLLQTISNSSDEKIIELFGPPKTKFHFENLLKMCIFDNKVNVKITELEPSATEELFFLEKEKYKISCSKLDHSNFCLGYSFYIKDKRRINKKKLEENNILEGPHLQKLIEGKKSEYKNKILEPKEYTYLVKGKKIGIIWDTGICEGCDIIAKNCDILISESTHLQKLAEKSEQYKHLTAQQAAQIASRNNVKKLYLTHFSQRYKTVDELEQEAKDIFPETICAYDFLKIKNI